MYHSARHKNAPATLQASLPNRQLTCCLAAAVVADGTFRSRPDLSPPHLNVNIEYSGRCGDGSIFVASFVGDADLSDHAPLQTGAYILTDSGDLVWSGFTYFSTWAGNFQAARRKGQDVLFAFEGAHNGLPGHGHGHHTILNQHYQTIRTYRLETICCLIKTNS